MHATGAVRLTVDTRRQPASQCFAQYLQCLLRGQAGCIGLLSRQHGLSLRQCLLLPGQRLQRIGRCRRLRRGGRRGRCCACRGLQQARLGMRRQLRGECSLPFAQGLLTCGQPGLSIGQLLAAQIRHSQLMEQGWITHQVLLPIGAKPQHASSIASVAAPCAGHRACRASLRPRHAPARRHRLGSACLQWHGRRIHACRRAAVPVQRLRWERPVLPEKWQVQQVRQVLHWPGALLVLPGRHRQWQAQVPWVWSRLAEWSQARAAQRQPARFVQSSSPVLLAQALRCHPQARHRQWVQPASLKA